MLVAHIVRVSCFSRFVYNFPNRNQYDLEQAFLNCEIWNFSSIYCTLYPSAQLIASEIGNRILNLLSVNITINGKVLLILVLKC